jgi:hypothetical protein
MLQSAQQMQAMQSMQGCFVPQNFVPTTASMPFKPANYMPNSTTG